MILIKFADFTPDFIIFVLIVRLKMFLGIIDLLSLSKAIFHVRNSYFLIKSPTMTRLFRLTFTSIIFLALGYPSRYLIDLDLLLGGILPSIEINRKDITASVSRISYRLIQQKIEMQQIQI